MNDILKSLGIKENNYGACFGGNNWCNTDSEGIIEIPMTDVAGPGFAVGCALVGRRPIFVVRYQGFMWYNASSIVNYAAKSMQVWGKPCPIFIRSLAMEGNGIGHNCVQVTIGCRKRHNDTLQCRSNRSARDAVRQRTN